MITKVKSFLRPRIDKHLPMLSFTYRTMRDYRSRQKQHYQRTSLGFDFIGNASIGAEFFGDEETMVIKGLLNGADVFVDVGANIGFYTCLALSAGKSVIAFEPLPQNLHALYENIEINNFRDVEIYPVCLADNIGIGTLYGGNTGASLVSGWAGSPPSVQHKVALFTLDHLLANRLHKTALIKIDVEGAEYRLLKGSTKILKITPAPTWIVEIGLTEHHPDGINKNFIQTFEIFWQNGYHAYTGDNQHRRITLDDVSRWFKLEKRGFGTHNYLFSKS